MGLASLSPIQLQGSQAWRPVSEQGAHTSVPAKEAGGPGCALSWEAVGSGPEGAPRPPPAHLPGLSFLPSRDRSHMCSEEGNCKLIFISILEENLNSLH